MTTIFKKSLTVGLSALTIVASLSAASTPASARNGGAIAAGIIGGLALGAMAAGAANSYYAPRRAYAGSCWIERRPVTNHWGDVVGYRRIRVCE